MRLSQSLIETGVRHLRASDARLGAVIERVGGCSMRPRGKIYESLFRSVLYQQLAGNAAAAIERRVKACFDGDHLRTARCGSAVSVRQHVRDWCKP